VKSLDSMPVEKLTAAAFRIPLAALESDGTFEWDSTTLVVVQIEADGETGIGYTYTDAAAAQLINERLAPLIIGSNVMDVSHARLGMIRAVRNIGVPGLAATAISAVDAALWDIKARILGVSLTMLMGRVRDSITVYGSGGFTSMSDHELERQFNDWGEQGIQNFKMKVGRHPERDIDRVKTARRVIGGNASLFVDANGAYSRKQALRFAHAFADAGVTWFEEPVVSDDLTGLRMLCSRAPPQIEIAAGEYCYTTLDFRRMVEAEAVDVLQADATRCCGITGFLEAATIADSHCMALSSHTAPMLHLAPSLAVPRMRNLEWFHDHVLIERELFDGFIEPRMGLLEPDATRPGNGLTFKHLDAGKYAL
jgi:L-alanine-DL-glutamate epimerase-like enolase superfamily enzyme